MVPWHCWLSHAHWRDVELAVGRFTVPSHRWWNSLAHWRDDKLVAGRTAMPRHCRPFPYLLINSGGGGRTTVARFWAGGGGGQTKVPRHCCAMAVAARPMIVPLDSRPSLACSWMARMKAARTDGGGSGSGGSDGGSNGSALSAVRLLARATTSWRRGGQQCLGGHTRSVEGRGRNIGQIFKVGWAANVCTGRCLMGFFSRRGFYPLLI
jgi:hypothetical protein